MAADSLDTDKAANQCLEDDRQQQANVTDMNCVSSTTSATTAHGALSAQEVNAGQPATDRPTHSLALTSGAYGLVWR